jgi:hypothetical protein
MPMITNSEKATMKGCQNGHQSVHGGRLMLVVIESREQGK